MRVLDLFSGIGGFSLGLEWAGMSTVAFCELDPYCVKVLNKHWPDTPIHNDVKELDGHQYRGSVELVCGGFPCQPFSDAGPKNGTSDDRHLWPEMFRIIKECRPRWVIGENVSGFINMALDDVCLNLESEGYEVRTFVLPACSVDARHRRDRVFIVGYTREWGELQNVPNPNNQGLQGRAIPCNTESEGPTAEQLIAGYSERLSGGNWPSESGILRISHGVPNRVDRVKAVGNAVVPQLIKTIGELVLAANKEIFNDQARL
tara:strand:+ start:200 stop:982 length:783 start_codon:yes stop_codon:yes gene_type:complete